MYIESLKEDENLRREFPATEANAKKVDVSLD